MVQEVRTTMGNREGEMSDFQKFNKDLRPRLKQRLGYDYNFEEKVNYVRSLLHKTWNHQQNRINKLEGLLRESEKLLDDYESEIIDKAFDSKFYYQEQVKVEKIRDKIKKLLEVKNENN